MTSAEAAKEAGNAAFKAGDYEESVKHFSKAIDEEPTNASFYSNRAAAWQKLKNYANALADGNKCIELRPDWSKGYSRAGSALYMKGDFAEAITVYTKGLSLDPEDKMLSQGKAQAESKLEGGKKKKNRRQRKKKEEAKEEHEHVIGIDLGTTYSCVGIWKEDGVKILELPNGQRTIPSYVAFTEDGQRLVGWDAKAQSVRNSGNTVFDVKRIIGQRWTDTGVQKDCEHFPFKVSPNKDGKPEIEVEEKGEMINFQPEQISALVLSYCKKLAEDYLGEPVNKAVITVPAYFNDQQRGATKAAGTIAGLEVMRIINEPTAAALAYGLDQLVDKKAGRDACNVLIFDLGGGTFDVSILTIDDGVFTVKATGGDTRLGGEDFDNNLIKWLETEVEAKGITSVHKDSTGRAYQRLRKAAELAKRELSSAQTTTIKVEDLMDGKTFEHEITRAQFEKLNSGLFNTCMDTVRHVLKDAKMKTKDIDEIVMVGGSTRVPKIQEMLALEIFKGRTLCKSLNPDEAVAYGAAVQGAILSGRKISKTEDLLLMDVTPLSLGIETTGRVMSVIIPRNTPIPCVKTQTYTTEANYQTQVDVCVYEGERLKSDENNLLGEFTISGIESAKRGEPQVDVSFSINSDGILKVEAVDQKTKAKANISIANRSQASSEEVKRMIAEAEKYKREDEARIKKVEAKNELEATILEAMEVGRDIPDGKLGSILLQSAEKEQKWLEENYETATAGDIAMRRSTLNRRMMGQKNR